MGGRNRAEGSRRLTLHQPKPIQNAFVHAASRERSLQVFKLMQISSLLDSFIAKITMLWMPTQIGNYEPHMSINEDLRSTLTGSCVSMPLLRIITNDECDHTAEAGFVHVSTCQHSPFHNVA